MVSTIPGSDILTSGLNMISQSLQIPVIIFLIIFAIFAVLSLGSLVSEGFLLIQLRRWFIPFLMQVLHRK